MGGNKQMNAKRQTIWLVSMLSLMVVLSAYYLFTEDASKVDVTPTAANTQTGKEVKVDVSDAVGAKVDSKDASKVEVKPDPATDAKASAKSDAKTGTDKTGASSDKAASSEKAAAQKTDKAAAGQATTADQTKSDAQVLEKVQAAAKSGSDYFADAQLKRDNDISEKTAQLMTIITDSKQSNEAMAKAYNDLQTIEDMHSKMMNLEDQLTKDFPNAIVTKDGDKWQVTVQSTKLEKSQAVSIVDLTMKEMNVTQDKVVVKYIP
jgi:stage III sporulation protein AH